MGTYDSAADAYNFIGDNLDSAISRGLRALHDKLVKGDILIQGKGHANKAVSDHQDPNTEMIEADGETSITHTSKPTQPPPLDDEEKGEALLNAIEITSDSGVNSGFPYQINADCTRFWPRT